jgi:tetratricopeptide (TPR) repeat protein
MMRSALTRTLFLFAFISVLALASWATCGGGGGGGVGGMGGGGMTGDPQVYKVPWRLLRPEDPPVTSGLVVYWFPSSNTELQESSLRNSRDLTLYATQCVTMAVSDVRTPAGQKFASDAKLPIVVLAAPDGTVIGKLENSNGKLKVEQVEKLVHDELKQRENTLNQQMKDAKDKAKSGDNAAAIEMYRAVFDQKCLFPNKAKDAAKELKKLGVTDVGEVADPPIFDHARGAEIERIMIAGLKAEIDAKYSQAEKLYSQAHRMDPADPVPLRYLGELYRHETGEWDKARRVFNDILQMPADPLSRAVALHGLGKMTIHDGEFAKGVKLMEDSVQTYPLALANRNLAVYWNSEGDTAKADHYVHEALALDPADAYNLVFAAAFMAGNGHGDEALKIAREHEAMLPASYNLAAIYAQTGQRDKALALLKRHFFEYERYQAVRAEEMMEARVDAVFASLKNDPGFIALTAGADGKLDPLRTMSMDPRRGTAH